MREKVLQRSFDHLLACLLGQQTGGGRKRHSPVYRARSHLPPGTGREDNQGLPRQSCACSPISRLGMPGPGRGKGGPQILGAKPERVVERKEATAPGTASAEHLAGLLHGLHIPGEAPKLLAGLRSRRGWVGVWGPGNAAQRTPVSAQLANSRTFAKLPRAGEPPRSGPHHRG